MTKSFLLILVGCGLGFLVTSFTFDQKNVSTPSLFPLDHSDDSEPHDRLKIAETIPQTHPLEVDGVIEELFGDCSAEKEIEALKVHSICQLRTLKAKRFWKNMYAAEQEVLASLNSGDFEKLIAFTSCDSIDLNQSDIACEYERAKLNPSHFEQLSERYKEHSNSSSKHRWVRNRPNFSTLRNPNWIARSRLIIEEFTTPLSTEEKNVVLLLEKKTNGHVYIRGISTSY